MTKLSSVLQVVVGIVFLGSALGKLTGGQNDARDDLEIANWFWISVGIIELVLGPLLIASVKLIRFALPAATALAVIMVGAIGVHIRAGEYSTIVAPAVLLILLLTIIYVRWSQPSPSRSDMATN